MKTNRRKSWFVWVAAIAAIAIPGRVLGQTVVVKSSPASSSSAPQWTVQVRMVDSGHLDLAHSFQLAIYENLLEELNKTKKFKAVMREGDRNASEVPSLLILKTTVVKYTPGSETRRAVTTVSGATKLTVRTQLLTREGEIVVDRTVNGNVRFFGSNLRVTHNLARNIAKAVKNANMAAVRASYRDAEPATLNADGAQRSGGSVAMCSLSKGRL